MSSVVLQGDTSGAITLTVPAISGTNTVSIPAGTGTVAVQGVSTNIVSGTAVASTSGTSIDFTGILSWVKRITVMFNGTSTNGTSIKLVQIGAGSVTTSGYLGACGLHATGSTVTAVTTGFGIAASAATDTIYASMVIQSLGSNVWQANVSGAYGNTNVTLTGGGGVTLGGTLDRIRITTVNGTDTFDAGSINILYE